MPVRFEGSVMQVGNSLRITIPQEIAKYLNLERGDAVELWVDDHSMMMEKKIFVYDAIWGFREDILDARSRLGKSFKAHTSQPIGIPLHKYKGKLTIQKERVMLIGEDVESSKPISLIFSHEYVKDVFLGWDSTLRRLKDSRGSTSWDRPLRITIREGANTRILYIYAKRPEARIYGGENENILKML